METTNQVGSTYQEYIYKSRYARYLPQEGRREEWPETVSRYINFFKERIARDDIVGSITKKDWFMLEQAILNHDIMPSMRALMTAGKALERDNVAGYNCAYAAVDHPRIFDETLYILMCGTGVGFSVERQYINKLPEVAEEFHEVNTVIQVRDSKIGWASALKQLISLLYQGQVPRWDMSKLRPAGAPLHTFGGTSSGYEPLEELFKFTIQTYRGAAGRKLNSLEVHDVICKIADVVVCGGVRRSALISLSNLTDQRMRDAKSGEWYYAQPQRALANNSVCYTEKPDMGIFMQEWHSLYKSRAGERGVFNRVAAQKMCPERRDSDHDFGTNPCSEIVLRPQQFCNLTEVVCREGDGADDLRAKVRLATILGTLQSTLTDFRYISKKWKVNCEEERLLGVSLTGMMDTTLLNADHTDRLFVDLEILKLVAVNTNKEYAKLLGIPQSTAVTCVKPSGTVSQLVNASSGIHPRYAPHYIRRARGNVNDPITQYMMDNGVPHEVANNNPLEIVFSFPIASPSTATCVKDIGALQQLDHWKEVAVHYCEHKPSVSIYVKEHEWLDVAAWVYQNWDICSGVSFFPHDDHMYPQAPYEAITEEEYNKLVSEFPQDLSFEFDEQRDNTTSSQELACVAGACDL